jgi:hypothetical protein
VAVLLHYLQNLTADLIGQHGGPEENAGFEIVPIPTPTGDFHILAGHYYVHGILCEADPLAVPILLPDQETDTVTLESDRVAFRKDQYIEMVGDNTRKIYRLGNVDGRSLQLATPGKIAPKDFSRPRIRPVISFRLQPDFPVPEDDKIPMDGGAKCLVYLDVWERHLTQIEDESIREVALAGPDTATRAKVVWQVKVTGQTPPDLSFPTGSHKISPKDWPQWVEMFQPTQCGLLKARVRSQEASTDPCVISPKSQYRGAENQLYRVEIHKGGGPWDGNGNSKAAAATFKWSRENGSVVFPISELNGSKVTVESLGHDDPLSLKIGDWVEVVDDDYTLRGSAQSLLQVIEMDRTDRVVTLSDEPDGTVGRAPAKHPILRRWDHRAGDAAQGGVTLQEGAALVTEEADSNMWLDLEDGIQIQFQPSGDPKTPNRYRTSDYWLIPARVATGDVEWPKLRDAEGRLVLDGENQSQPSALPPHGVEHHYAPLAVLTLDSNGNVTSATPDLRHTFKPKAS